MAGAQAAVVATEWPEMRDADWAAVRRAMLPPRVVFAGRNCLDPGRLPRLGLPTWAWGGVQQARRDGYELVALLKQERIAHYRAHPLVATRQQVTHNRYFASLNEMGEALLTHSRKWGQPNLALRVLCANI